ncbi:MAG TPA: glycosyltransferase family 2 protein [Ignavibacteria bacterium]|nr:glycosyltransferase family 2 protein [Ignavibacteria bacterium]HMR39498.1 glycosyltransferase family 2 protein [Ignavibacteria bacterium]
MVIKKTDMVSVVIINYKQKKYTEECVRSVYGTFKTHPFEIIIVNNSPEESLSYLKTEFPDLKIIENDNKGYSEANNKGAQIASGDHFLFLNADTIIKSDFLNSFMEAFKEIDFGAAGLKLKNPDGSVQLSFWKENNFFNEINNKSEERKFRKKNTLYISEKEKEYGDIKEVDWVTGAAIMIKKDTFEKVNGFDDDYFLFYEDADICKRLTDAGYRIYFYPGSDIIHYKGENVNSEFQSATYYYSKESQLLYYEKHNDLFNNIALRSYLFVKFFIKYLVTFKKINLRIFLLAAGIKIK